MIPIEKSVGLFCSNYALCHIYANKNFYELQETACFSVHIDNSRVSVPCSLTITQLTKITCKKPTPGKPDKTLFIDWKVHKEVSGPLARSGEKKSVLIKFNVDRSDMPRFTIDVDPK